MAKFKKLLGGKKKKSKKEEAEASPLMAGTSSRSTPSTFSSARLEVEDPQREERKKEREERKKQRDQRLAESQGASQSSKAKAKKEKSKPKLSLEEQDAKDAKLGCCFHMQKVLVKIVHVLDAAIGLTFLIYGLFIMTFENPAEEAYISCIAFGATMLFTSIMGAVGFYSRMCWRWGLVLSAWTAPFIAFFYVFVIIALLSSGDLYFDYLKEHKDVMELDDNEIKILQQILPFFYIALASLAAIEVIRFMTLRKLRGELLRADSAKQRISSREKTERSQRSNLTSPLIDDDEESGIGV